MRIGLSITTFLVLVAMVACGDGEVTVVTVTPSLSPTPTPTETPLPPIPTPTGKSTSTPTCGYSFAYMDHPKLAGDIAARLDQVGEVGTGVLPKPTGKTSSAMGR